MINPPHLGVAWLDALRVLLPIIISVVAIGSLIALPWLLQNDDRENDERTNTVIE